MPGPDLPLTLISTLALAVPASYLAIAACQALAQRLRRIGALPPHGPPSLATERVALAAFACSVLSAVTYGWASATPQPIVLRGGDGTVSLSMRLDIVSYAMLLLVSFIGWVITRFSRRYLSGEPRQAAFLRDLALTLAAVSTLVLTNNLLVLALAWTATSFALHQLLTFYRERPQALVAAHKKFMVSRLADLFVAAALALVGSVAGTLELDGLEVWARAQGALSPAMHAAAVMLVAAVALKCAQLPFHGWLTQVMEAPTPVSALLHAGVVNIGGFLLIRLAPLMTKAEGAQVLLVAIGTLTAVTAALVMMTRVSVKVMLAWSTIAQMGFMLVQCGLGAYALALLHLVAHSLYKAHAFLSAGSAVDVARAALLAPKRPAPGLARSWLAVPLSLAIVIASAWALGARPEHEPSTWALTTVLVLALTPWLVHAAAGAGGMALAAFGGAALCALYFVFHEAAASLFASPAPSAGLALSSGVATTGFVGLFVLQTALLCRPQSRLALALYPALFLGLHLDELFTRLTFRIWPPTLPPRPARYSSLPVITTTEV